MAKKSCPECLYEIDENESICPHCGHMLDEDLPQNSRAEVRPKKRGWSFGNTLIALLLVLLIAGLGYLLYIYGLKLPYEIRPRRPGDIATCYSSPDKAKRELGWEAQYGIEEMCRDSWNWQKQNPNGYKN